MTNEVEEEQEEASRPEVTQLRDMLEEIVAYDISEDLIRENDLGFGNSFATSQKLFQEVIDYAERLRALPWRDIPEKLVNQVRDSATQLRNVLQTVKLFSVEEGNVTARRDDAANLVRADLDTFRTITVPYVGFNPTTPVSEAG